MLKKELSTVSDCMLKIENFSKQFRSHWTFRPMKAVHDVSLEVFKGELFGFIGHNGAGKTTTIKSVLGLLTPTAGKFYLDGKELTDARQRSCIGYLPEQPYFYDHLTVSETLVFFASLYGMSKKQSKPTISKLLSQLHLDKKAKSPVRTLSKGQQQRLGIAQAVMNEPSLLFLDEPFSGLDPLGRKEIRELIVELNQSGTTIFLSSHILSDVQDICDRVAILANGKLKAVYNIDKLPELFGTQYQLIICDTESIDSLKNTLRDKATSHETKQLVDNSLVTFTFSDYETSIWAIHNALLANAKIVSFQRQEACLEDIFIKTIEQDNINIEGSLHVSNIHNCA